MEYSEKYPILLGDIKGPPFRKEKINIIQACMAIIIPAIFRSMRNAFLV
jgi:hypothetical protein